MVKKRRVVVEQADRSGVEQEEHHGDIPADFSEKSRAAWSGKNRSEQVDWNKGS